MNTIKILGTGCPSCNKTEAIDYENIPNVVFCEPQVSGVGLTESQAREKNYDISVSKQFFSGSSPRNSNKDNITSGVLEIRSS